MCEGFERGDSIPSGLEIKSYSARERRASVYTEVQGPRCTVVIFVVCLLVLVCQLYYAISGILMQEIQTSVYYVPFLDAHEIVLTATTNCINLTYIENTEKYWIMGYLDNIEGRRKDPEDISEGSGDEDSIEGRNSDCNTEGFEPQSLGSNFQSSAARFLLKTREERSQSALDGIVHDVTDCGMWQ